MEDDADDDGVMGIKRSGASRIKAVQGLSSGVSDERRADGLLGAEVRGSILRGKEVGERP